MIPTSRFAHPLIAFIAIACLFLLSAPALASTYYVRTDGGTVSQCTGTANAAYPGSGSGKACAWHSPMDALPPAGYSGRLKGGDTLVIGPGQYAVGTNSDTMAAYPSKCTKNYPYDCRMQPPPSGTASQPTRIVGAGWDSGCSAPPQIYGVSGVWYTLDVGSSSNIVVGCLELTDHSACMDPYPPDGSIACKKSYPYGDWSEMGVHAAGGSNVTLQDLNIHGFANSGLTAGGMKNFTLRNVTIRGNGFVGWNGDLGGSGNSSFSGTITLDNVRVLWNGCTEQYPATTIYACWGANQGGYGDGVGMAKTGGNWVITNSTFNYNSSDGLDLLYADGSGSVTIDRVTAIGNAGNQIKTAGTATITNSVVVGDCDALAKFPNMDGDNCRAGGGALALEVAVPAQKVTLAYNTITGEGDCLIQGGTDVGVPTASSQVYEYDNNIFVGQASYLPKNGGAYTCLAWYTDSSPNLTTIKYTSNLVWHTRDMNCNTSGIICKDPQLVNEALSGFDANLLTSSPATGNANRSAYSVAWDYYGNARAASGPLDIGAVAYRGQAYIGSGDGDSPVPPSDGSTPPPAADAPVTPPPASDPPVAAPPPSGHRATINPIFNHGGSRPDSWYSRIRASLIGERHDRIGASGAAGTTRASRPVQTTPASRATPARAADASRSTTGAVASIANPAGGTNASQQVRRSFGMIVYDWAVGTYHRFF